MNDKQILKKVIEWLIANIDEEYLNEALRQDSNKLLLKIDEWKKEKKRDKKSNLIDTFTQGNTHKQQPTIIFQEKIY